MQSLEQPDQIAFALEIDHYAQLNCRGGAVDRENCAWYHGTWKYLKALNLVSCPDWHLDFYRESINRAVASCASPPLVLISGSADDSMLAVVLHALDEQEPGYRVFATDMCRTPLHASRKRLKNDLGNSVLFVQSRVPRLPVRDGSFDVVVTDAFLTRFDTIDRRAVIAEWRRVLRDGGHIVTTARVDAANDVRPNANEAEIEAFVRNAETLGQLFGFPPNSIVSRAREYASRMRSHPFTSLDELIDLFLGFDVSISYPETEFVDVVPRRYARIFARKK